ncbi:tripartite tricarboxylate transporter family receptor domain protein, partial [Bordetella pertussis H897]
MAELVARLKAAPGRYNYASQGVGSLSHLESALFLDGSKAQAEHVPYKGSAEALPGLMSGETAFMFDSVASVRTHVAAGKLVALGTSASGRVPQFPDAPTMAELGIADLKADNPFAFVAPAGTPPAVIAVLTDAVRTALADPKIIETLTRAGMVPASQPRAGMASWREKYSRVQACGARPEAFRPCSWRPSQMMANRSPPMPFMHGPTTVMVMAAAIAASTALPPAASMRMAAWLASGCSVQTMFSPSAGMRCDTYGKVQSRGRGAVMRLLLLGADAARHSEPERQVLGGDAGDILGRLERRHHAGARQRLDDLGVCQRGAHRIGQHRD